MFGKPVEVGEKFDGFCRRGADGRRYPVEDVITFRAPDEETARKELSAIFNDKLEKVKEQGVKTTKRAGAILADAERAVTPKLRRSWFKVIEHQYPETWPLLNDGKEELAAIAFKIAIGSIHLSEIPDEEGLREYAALCLTSKMHNKHTTMHSVMLLLTHWEKWTRDGNATWGTLAASVSKIQGKPISAGMLRKGAGGVDLYLEE